MKDKSFWMILKKLIFVFVPWPPFQAAISFRLISLSGWVKQWLEIHTGGCAAY